MCKACNRITKAKGSIILKLMLLKQLLKIRIRIMKTRRMRLAGNVTRMGENTNVCRLLVGKPEGRRPLGRLRRRWLDNIMLDLVEVGWGDVDWIGLAQDKDSLRALVNSVLNLRVP
jgi:hypothetical protein